LIRIAVDPQRMARFRTWLETARGVQHQHVQAIGPFPERTEEGGGRDGVRHVVGEGGCAPADA
jgi:hypothetical protein